MLEISTSGLMSGDGKRSGLFRAQPPRPSSTLLNTHLMSVLSCSSSDDKACGLIAAGGRTSLVSVELE